MDSKQIRKQAISDSAHWWYCDNIVCHPGEFALLRMDFPQVFILIRDETEAYITTYEDFCDKVAEVNFFNPADRETADIKGILTEAWNFLALEEEAEEEYAQRRELEEDDEFDY